MSGTIPAATSAQSALPDVAHSTTCPSIAPEIADDLHEPMLYAEERLYDHLAAVPSPDPIVLAGQVVGLLAACELLPRSFRRSRWPRSASISAG